MATIDDRISFRYYREHCHDIRYNAKKFGCEHNGIIYGADMCAIGFGIMTNIDGDANYLIQEECKGKIEFKHMLKKIVAYFAQYDKYFNRMLKYDSRRQFHVYSEEEYQRVLFYLNKHKNQSNADVFRDLNFIRQGQAYHMSVNVNICQQMLYCCEIVPEEEREHWFFCVKVAPCYEDKHSKNYQSRNKKARQLSDEQLFEQYKKRKTNSKKRRKGTRIEPYERNEMVAEIAKRRAKGICDLADEDGNYHQAPFEVDGMPFLESHHVMWLSKGGDDDIDNVVALCPNCHRKVHVLQEKKDVDRLKERLLGYCDRISRH